MASHAVLQLAFAKDTDAMDARPPHADARAEDIALHTAATIITGRAPHTKRVTDTGDAELGIAFAQHADVGTAKAFYAASYITASAHANGIGVGGINHTDTQHPKVA